MIVRRIVPGLAAGLSAMVAVVAMTATPAQAANWNRLKNAHTGMCLDASESQGVRIQTCNSGSYQLWSGLSTGQLLHRQTGKCLDASVSQGVRINTCNGDFYQAWHASGSQLIQDGTYKCLDASVSQGVRFVACNGGDYQAWSTY